ncbi:hypothetical protein V8C37DRAFT_387589 [Trichoderma ceciliae]
MAHAPELEPHKRKRDVDDDGSQPTHHRQPIAHEPASRQSSSSALSLSPSPLESVINFLPRHNAQLLALIPGDVDTFADIIYLIGEYEGVLDRSESLAANLGAKLTGPRFLRGIERFFDGPIKTNSPHPYAHQITWLDVVSFAKTNPSAFSLVPMPNGTRCCRFMYHGLQVEITEDDWRLVSSGALDKFPLEHTFEEDEAAELATLEIIEQRASVLFKKADEIAGRARILHHRIGLRRKDVGRRRQLHDDGAAVAAAASASSSFHAINHPPRTAIPRPGSSPSPYEYDIHAELLRQFAMAAMQHFPPPGPPPGYQLQPTSGTGVPVATDRGPLVLPHLEVPPYHPLPDAAYPTEIAEPAASTSASTLGSTLGSTPTPASTSNSKSTSTIALSQVVLPGDPATEVHRPLVLQKIDTLNKGEIIFPPCDRCRRLRLQCVKHLTACRGCTKKHARCNWRSVTDDEAATLKHELDALHHDSQNGGEVIAGSVASGSAAPQSEANSISRPASGSDAGPSPPVSYGKMDLGLVVPRLIPGLGPVLAPPRVSAPGAEPPRKMFPTSRLTRIEPAPTVLRDPPRTGQLASILSPPDYEPRPFVTLPKLAPVRRI